MLSAASRTPGLEKENSNSGLSAQGPVMAATIPSVRATRATCLRFSMNAGSNERSGITGDISTRDPNRPDIVRAISSAMPPPIE